MIQKLIGSPDDSSLGFLRSNHARRYVKQLPQYPKQQFAARFPNMSPAATDLLEKMLVFDPNKRITGTVEIHLYSKSLRIRKTFLVHFLTNFLFMEICLQRTKHFVTLIYHPSMTLMMSPSVQLLSVLISSSHPWQKTKSKSSYGRNLWSLTLIIPLIKYNWQDKLLCFWYKR